MTKPPEEKGDKWFRVSVCLEQFFSDERARCFVGVSGARHVRWLSRRLRRLFPALPRRLALLTQGHLLPPDEPLALLRPDDVVQVVPIPADFNREDSVSNISESRQAALNTDPPAAKRKKISLSFHKKKKPHGDLDNNLSDEISHATSQPQIGLTENTTPSSIQNKIVDKCSQSEIKECALERETSPHLHTEQPVQQRKNKIRTDQNNENNSMLDDYFGNDVVQSTPLAEISLPENETSTLSANILAVEPSHVDLLKEVKERALTLIDNAVAFRRRRRVRRRRRPQPGFIPEPLMEGTVSNVDEPSNDDPMQVSEQETPNPPAESLLVAVPDSEGELEHNSVNAYEISKDSSDDTDNNLHSTLTMEESEAPAFVNNSNVTLPVTYRWAAGAPPQAPAVVRNEAACRRTARIVRPLETGVEPRQGQLLPSVQQATSLPA